jgi:hypothetical protein
VNVLLLNRDGFQTPADGWYQVAPMGEFGHAQAGLTQVVDAEACLAMVNRFAEEAKAPNFAGLLVDFDHFSLDGEKRSEAAGWITALQNRDGGLFAKIRWSDVGESAVKGGRYRFLSPVWNRADCVELGGGRVRPVRLLNAAVTNDPNLKGMRPLSNSAAAAAAPRFKWVLGNTPEGRHCPSCAAVAGQVHTMAEWDAGGVKPGADGLLCQGNCQCQLVPTDEAAGGSLADVPVRNRSDDASRKGDSAQGGKTLANTGWTDEARAASLAVRQSKAGARGGRDARLQERQRDSMDKAGRDYAAIYEEKGLKGMTAEEVAYLSARISVKVRNGTKLTGPEERFVKERGLSATAAVRNRVVKAEGDRIAAREAAAAVHQMKAAFRARVGVCASSLSGFAGK